MDYPLQIHSVKRQKQVLSIESHLAIPGAEDGGRIGPLETPGYSRYRIVIIDKTGKETITPFCNIPENDIAYIKKATDIALTKILEPAPAAFASGMDPSLIAQNKEAFELRYRYGEFNGKTAIEVLGSDPGKKDALLRYKSHLGQGVDRFVINIDMMKGIDQAVKLLEEGKLSNVSTATSPTGGVITIYDQQHKYLTSIKDKSNRCLTYSVNMVCDLARKYPFIITLENGFAYVKQTATGGSNIDKSSIVNNTKAIMYLTDVEFVTIVDKMYTMKRDFTSANFMKQYNYAKKVNNEQKESASKAASLGARSAS